MDSQPNIRLLKIIVIVLGVLIIISAGIVIIGIATRTGGPANSPAAVSAVLPPVPPMAPAASPAEPQVNFGQRKLDLPRGSRVIELRTEAHRLIVRVRHVGGGEQIILLHMGTGERLGAFDIESAE